MAVAIMYLIGKIIREIYFGYWLILTSYENKLKINLLANRQFAIIKSAILFFEQVLRYARKIFLKTA